MKKFLEYKDKRMTERKIELMEEDYNELIYLLRQLLIRKPKPTRRLLNVIYNSTQKSVCNNKFHLYKEWEKYLDKNNPVNNTWVKAHPTAIEQEPQIPYYIKQQNYIKQQKK